VAASGAASRQAAGIDDRDLRWEGCFNARDLGRPPAAGGHATRSLAAFLARRGATAEGLVVELLEGLDLAALLLGRGGLVPDDLAAVRARPLA
jgi:hypothetical protein